MTPATQLTAFLARHHLLLSREREAEVERSSLLLSKCGPKLLEQKGLALNGVGVVGINIGLGGKTLVELDRPAAYHPSPIFPPHTFRPGDLARIEENVSANAPTRKAAKSKKTTPEKDGVKGAEGVVYKVSETRIIIAVDLSDSPSSDDLDLPERCRVVKIANSITYDRMDKVLDRLEKFIQPTSGPSQQPNQLTRVLLGLSPPSDPSPLSSPIVFFDPNLNPSQRAAVQFALEANEVACIHGPPGTGKTWTLVEIVRQLVASRPPAASDTGGVGRDAHPKKILICGASNLAVDNILERLLLLPEQLNVTRVGHPARVMRGGPDGGRMLEAALEVRAGRSDEAALARDVKVELESALAMLSGKAKGQKGKALRGAERRKMWEEVRALRKEYRLREGGVVKKVLAETQIVLATCHSSGGRQLDKQEFDVVIIDEATQALEAVCWIPILKAKKLILAGDPMQLPPTIISIDKKVKEKKEANVKRIEKALGDKKRLGEKEKDRESGKATETAPQATSNVEISDGESGDEKTPDDEDTLSVDTNLERQAEKGRKLSKLRPPRTLETTLFDRLERMYGPRIKRMLDVQYRMHGSICAFPSQTLYSRKLVSHESVRSHLLRDLPEVKTKPISEEDQKDILGTPVVFFDTSGCEYFERLEGDGDEGSRCNENETVVVKRWIDQLTATGLLPSQIAVITPYQAQVTLLTSLLRPLHGQQLEIGTVDGMQGREKEAVIISLVRSNEKREVGFLKEKRRLNVAMTRARRHLCIVGDSSTVQHGSAYLKKWIAWLETNADVRYAGSE